MTPAEVLELARKHGALRFVEAVQILSLFDYELSALIAEVEARTLERAWQPIETAPKDGTHILLANESGTSEGGWLSDIDHGAEWEGQIGMAGWWRADGTDWPCTHWQPLPSLKPGQGADSQGGGNADQA